MKFENDCISLGCSTFSRASLTRHVVRVFLVFNRFPEVYIAYICILYTYIYIDRSFGSPMPEQTWYTTTRKINTHTQTHTHIHHTPHTTRVISSAEDFCWCICARDYSRINLVWEAFAAYAFVRDVAVIDLMGSMHPTLNSKCQLVIPFAGIENIEFTTCKAQVKYVNPVNPFWVATCSHHWHLLRNKFDFYIVLEHQWPSRVTSQVTHHRRRIL